VEAVSVCQVVLAELVEKVDKPELTSSKIQTGKRMYIKTRMAENLMAVTVVMPTVAMA
jgi:hypothetical protein